MGKSFVSNSKKYEKKRKWVKSGVMVKYISFSQFSSEFSVLELKNLILNADTKRYCDLPGVSTCPSFFIPPYQTLLL